MEKLPEVLLFRHFEFQSHIAYAVIGQLLGEKVKRNVLSDLTEHRDINK